MIENIDQQDIQETKQEIKQEETLDQILQSKISDSTALEKAKPIFEEVQKSFKEPINNYIKTSDLDFLLYAIDSEDPVRTLIEEIDMAT